jgi:hypothetical protein
MGTIRVDPQSHRLDMRLVLDTNVVLDWLLFRDSTLQSLNTTTARDRSRRLTPFPN